MINYNFKYSVSLYGILGLICAGVFFLQRIGGLSLRVGNATPLLLLPFVVAVAIFLREWTGFWFGLVSGIALDTVMSRTYCFNTFMFLLIGVLVGLIFRFFLNRNIKSAIIVSAIMSFSYFILKWLFLTVFFGDGSAFQMLFKYNLPSSLYTTFFVIPFFYIVKHFSQKHITN